MKFLYIGFYTAINYLSQLIAQEQQVNANLGCFVPDNGFLSMIDSLTNDTLTPGTYVQSQTSIEYVCPKRFYVDGEYMTNFCLDDWINPHPKCIKMCSPIKGVTINSECYYKGEDVDCNTYSMPGTTAKIICAFMYQKPQDRHVYEDLRCLEDGEWDHSAFKCEQMCGTVDTKVPLIVKSKITEVQKVPWQVAIYRKNKDETYEHICGGTLIQSKIVITAAHCFWDTTKPSLQDRSNFVIAVGKYYRDYYATNETQSVQKLNIFKIDVPVQFAGADYDFISDIAVLTLADHVIFKTHIRPACLTWKAHNGKYMPNNVLGTVAGWGITDTGTYSTELRSVKFSSVAGESCKKKITKNDKISGDKFCIETTEGKNVCEGDSGGGFLVPVEINGVTYYHLEGVVSNGIGQQMCNSHFVTTFTNIQWYESFIIQSVTNNLLESPSTRDALNCFVPIDSFLILTDRSTKKILTPGSNANKSTHIYYTCSEDFVLSGINGTNFCDGEWINLHPKCIKMCQPIVGITINPVCVHKEKTIPCNVPVEPGTTAKIGCAFLYHKPQDRYVNEDLLCEDDGKWNYSPFECEQECGTVDTIIPFLVNSDITPIKEVPWVVAIYSNRYPVQNNKYQHICSGTLVKSNIVISSAYCYWNDAKSEIFDQSNFIVVAGKNFRDYYSNEEIGEVQISNISTIKVPDLFDGADHDYVSNIAVLALDKDIVYKNHIRPACITTKKHTDKFNFENKSGLIAGWGYADGFDYSPVLRSIELSAIDAKSCQLKIRSNERIPRDGFCVEVMDGKKISKGDSGAGFLVPEYVDGTKRYYVRGVVGITKGDNITTFTSTSPYESLILESESNDSSVAPFGDNFFRCFIPKNSLFIMSDISTNSSFISGTYVPLLTRVKYTCSSDYLLDGVYSTNFCKNGQWINPHPECIKVCPPIKDYTIDAQCLYNEKNVSCSNRRIVPGTVAKVNCKFMYKKPQDQPFYEDLYCKDDGNWSSPLFRCEQVCGSLYSETFSNQNNNMTKVHNVPWQAAIYYKGEEEKYMYFCSGAMISSKIIISVAHCFWSETEENIRDISKFVISVGKFYSDYYASNETETVQNLSISRIDVPIQYQGARFDLGGDIAVITLDSHIVFKNHIRPACLTWLNFNNKDIPSDLLGIVAGWGVSNSRQVELFSVELVSINHTDCRDKLKGAQYKLTRDKFCIGVIEEKIKCMGISGSGFVVPWIVNGVVSYNLWGVVSTGYNLDHTKENFCNSDSLIGLVNVQKYESLIKTAIANVH